MIVFDMLAWWYTTAWFELLRKTRQRVTSVIEAFSVGLLARTLFAPFRQIDAGNVRGPIGVQLRAWFDRTFSRFLGAIVRTIVIVSGCIMALFISITGIIWAVLWLVMPVTPILGLIVMVAG